jgi:hypothetical protein
MDWRSSPYAFALPFPDGRALVLFRAMPHEAEAVRDILADLICDELHESRVRPTRWTEPDGMRVDPKLPPLRPSDIRTRRQRLFRRVLMSDTAAGRSPVGLIHEVGFWVMFPCHDPGAAERLVDRLSP